MSEHQFEQTVAYHCAPSLAGIKPADLISLEGGSNELAPLLTGYARAMKGAGIRFRLLRRSGGRCLLLVYRQNRMEAQLQRREVRRLLAREGYPVEDGVDAMLLHLEGRLAQEDFPHEIGLFLGYPPEDVEGFRRHAGRNYKLSGLWKVYSDVDRAQAYFRRYSSCRRALSRQIESGRRLAGLFQAV